MSVIRARDGITKMPQVARFLVAGGCAALITWLVRFPLSHFMPFPIAVVSANLIGMVFGFITYRHFVFPPSSRLISLQVRDFTIVNLVSTIVVVGVSMFLVDRVFTAAGFVWQAEAVSHAVGIAAGAVSNYLGHSCFSFARE